MTPAGDGDQNRTAPVCRHCAMLSDQRPTSFARLLLPAWFICAGVLLWQQWRITGTTLGDSDDAMRLVQLRAFLNGRDWFDLHEPRIYPPLGYDSLWSRLIDAGLAGLLTFFQQFARADQAEWLTRLTWPLLWLLPAMASIVAVTRRIGGNESVPIVLIFLLLGYPAFQQFNPGRVDHHNVQITLALLVIAATTWSDRYPPAPIIAGLVSSLALAIGFEGAPFIVACGAAFAARFVADRASAGAMRAYGISLALGTLGVFLIGVGPQHWTTTACDALALNSAVAVIFGASALAVTAMFLSRGRALSRLAALAAAAVLAFAIFALLDPRCLAGPFAVVDASLRAVWLGNVKEIQSMASVAHKFPLTFVALIAFPAIALICSAVVLGSPTDRRDFAFLFTFAVFVLALVLTLRYVRIYHYAMWLSMPLVAASLARLQQSFALRPAMIGLLAAAIAPASSTILFVAGAERLGWHNAPAESDPACFRNDSYKALAHLPPGLIAADVDYGSFILAFTPHSVLAAPYHRVVAGILDSHRALASPPDEALEIVQRTGANYVAICGERPPELLNEVDRRRSLWAQLRAGNTPPWLEPVDVDGPFSVYRVTRSR